MHPPEQMKTPEESFTVGQIWKLTTTTTHRRHKKKQEYNVGVPELLYQFSTGHNEFPQTITESESYSAPKKDQT